MKLDRVRPGAIVECEKLGRKFRARVVTVLPDRQGVDVEPLDSNVSYRHLTARQVLRILEPAPVAGEQLGLGGLA